MQEACNTADELGRRGWPAHFLEFRPEATLVSFIARLRDPNRRPSPERNSVANLTWMSPVRGDRRNGGVRPGKGGEANRHGDRRAGPGPSSPVAIAAERDGTPRIRQGLCSPLRGRLRRPSSLPARLNQREIHSQ